LDELRFLNVRLAAGSCPTGTPPRCRAGVEPGRATFPLVITTLRDVNSRGDGQFLTTDRYDQRGHVGVKTEGDHSSQHLGPFVSGNNTFEAVSNPQFVTPDATAGWTRTIFDQLNRPIETDYYAGTTAPPPWGNNSATASSQTTYNGYSTTFADESGNSRQQTVDGAGRLIQVVEDTTSSLHLNYTTTYTYDGRDNLKQVNQSGQTRTFSYSSLGRLLSASNPETTNPTTYAYDGSGNLVSKTDARGIITRLGYDGANRLGTKQYSDGTATVTYCYGDGIPLPQTPGIAWSCGGTPPSFSKGRLTSLSGDTSQPVFSQYDELGRVRASQQTTNTAPFSFSYTHAPAGLQIETFPSGRQLTWTYDTSSRINALTGTLGSTGTTYASVSSFWPSGAAHSTSLNGVGIGLASAYDSRLRPNSLSVSASNSETLGYTWNPNGNLRQETIQLNSSTITQAFGYDPINRLISATESAGSTIWTQNFGYDAFGNRSLLASSTFIPYAGVTPQAPAPGILGQTVNGPFANNRFTGASYDNSGNVTGGAATVTPTSTATYDAENRMQTVTDSGTFLRYYYDGGGHRVLKANCSEAPCSLATASQVATYVYDANDDLAAEYGTTGPVTGTQYVFTDHLGSTRALVSTAGTFTRCYDYAPFGEPLVTGTGPRATCYTDVSSPSLAPGATSIKFTAKERDAETGLDFFGGRYFSGAQGRFTSPDPHNEGAQLLDPQSWNMYSYVGNNPLRYVDPDGRDRNVCINGQGCQEMSDEQFEIWLKRNKDLVIFNGASGKLEDRDTEKKIGSATWFDGDALRRAQNAEAFMNFFMVNQALSMASEGLGALFVGLRAGAPSRAAFQGGIRLQGAVAERIAGAQLALKGYRIVGRQVRVLTSARERIVDFVVERGGEYTAIEVKSGEAVRDAGQLSKDAAMATEGGLIKNGAGGVRTELTGQTMKLRTIEMRPF
jgi:RHS repeat-associated protein